MFALTRLVLRECAVAAPDHHVVAPPGELLDVGAVVGEGHGAAVVAHLGLGHVRDGVEVLEGGRQHVAMVDQVTQRHTRPGEEMDF